MLGSTVLISLAPLLITLSPSLDIEAVTNQLQLEMTQALKESPAATDTHLAPPVPPWPDWVPGPDYIEYQGQRGMFFAFPSDYVLSRHLLWWSKYPDLCQTRINNGWSAVRDLEGEIHDEVTVQEGWSTIKVVFVVAGSILLTSIVAGGAGYLIGAAR